MTTEDLTFFVPADYRHMERWEYADGVRQMLADLERLARAGGCTAAWVLDAPP